MQHLHACFLRDFIINDVFHHNVIKTTLKTTKACSFMGVIYINT